MRQDKREWWGLCRTNDTSLCVEGSKESQHQTSQISHVSEEVSLQGLWPGSGFRRRPQVGGHMRAWDWQSDTGMDFHMEAWFNSTAFLRSKLQLQGPRCEPEMQAADIAIRSIASSTSLPGSQSQLCPHRGCK